MCKAPTAANTLLPLRMSEQVPLHRPPIPPLSRRPVDTQLVLGIRAIDGLLALGHGQRIGIFAGAGIGKSTLLGAMAKSAQADVSVIALIAVIGSPLVHGFGIDPTNLNTWVLFFPYIWLPSVLVMIAIFGHIVITRKLLQAENS